MLLTKALLRVGTRNTIKRRYNAVAAFSSLDTFPRRHIGPSEKEIEGMLQTCGLSSLEDLSDKVTSQFFSCELIQIDRSPRYQTDLSCRR